MLLFNAIAQNNRAPTFCHLFNPGAGHGMIFGGQPIVPKKG